MELDYYSVGTFFVYCMAISLLGSSSINTLVYNLEPELVVVLVLNVPNDLDLYLKDKA